MFQAFHLRGLTTPFLLRPTHINYISLYILNRESFIGRRPKYVLITHSSTLMMDDHAHALSHPDSRSDPNGGSEPSSGRETIYWDSLPVFFFFLAELVPVGIQTISVITKIIYINKRTTTGVVSINIYRHILFLVPFTYTYTRKLFISITYSERRTYCDEPLLVCWPSCMQKIADVLLCTYTD